jgi:CRP/FNR family transcriptional regulator
MFNEVSVLDGGANLATAEAVEDCVAWQIDQNRFGELLRRYPQVGLGLLRVLAQRTRLLLSKYEDLSFRSVLARTAKLLLDLSRFGEDPIDRQKHPNREMAAAISTVPEALSRSLQVFKRNGDIICTRRSIAVRNPETLAKLAELGPYPFQM